MMICNFVICIRVVVIGIVVGLLILFVGCVSVLFYNVQVDQVCILYLNIEQDLDVVWSGVSQFWVVK